MLELFFEAIIWAVIGAIFGFYVAYVKGYDTRPGAVGGAVLGVIVGPIATTLGIVTTTFAAFINIVLILAIAYVLLPDFSHEKKSNPIRRFVVALGGFFVVSLGGYLFTYLLIASGIIGTTAAQTALILVQFLLALGFLVAFVPRGNFIEHKSIQHRVTDLAYALSIPTVVIVVGIVIFPVIWNVIFSLRDIETGDLGNVELFDLREVSLDNYENQMRVRIDPLPCEQDEAGNCLLDDEGNVVYEDARRYIGSEYRGYREVNGIAVNEQYYAIGVRDREFYPMIFRTLFYTIASTTLAIVFGLIAALVVRDNFPGRNVFRGFILFPYIAPVISVAFIWQVLLRQNGLINEAVGTNVSFLSTTDTFVGIAIPLIMVILFQTWRYFPFAFLFLLARIQAIPDDMYEAAKVDGATPSQRLIHITLPQLRAVFGTLFLLRFIWTFNKFDDVFLLTGPLEQTRVIPIQIFEALFTESDVGQASAIAVVMALILAVILLIYFRFFLVEEA